jgi:hypothetical protein
MAGSSFQVNVPSGFASADVQNLSATEKELAHSMGLSEDEFRGRKFEYLIAEQWRFSRGRELGKLVEQVLAELEGRYRLLEVTWNRDTKTWRLGIQGPSGFQNVVLKGDLADLVLDYRTRGEFDRLRNMVLFGLGLTDLVFKGRR